MAQAPLETKKFLAYIPEQIMLYPHLTGVENLKYFAALARHDGYSKEELRGFLRRSGLQEEAHDHRVSTYSKGMRQKVGIAVALAKQAEALLLDEPTSGLDPEASNEFSGLLQRLRGDGVAILMATHDLFRAKEVGSRVGIMRRGVLRAELGPSELDHVDLERIYLEHMHDGSGDLTMLRHIVRKEILETVRDGRFRWGAALVGVLLFLSLAAGFAQRQEVDRAHASAQAMSWAQWLEQGDKNPHSAAHYGIYVFRPVSTLSFVDRGVDPYMGVSTWLEAHYQNPFEHRAVQDTPALARFADLTAANTLQLLVPLLILLLAFPSFTGEREQGTLRQLLSVGVDPRRLATGKVLNVGVALALFLVPAALVGALALLMAGPGGGAVANEGLRYLVLVGTYLLYFGIFTGLAVGVSALAPTSRTALALLLYFWILNGLVAPRVASDVARNRVPLPSSLEFQQAIQSDLSDGFADHPSREDRQQILRDRVLAAHGVDDPAELPFNFAGLSLQSGEEFAYLVFDRRFGELAVRVREQLELHRRLGFVAPHLSVRSLSMALTGTDPAHHELYSNTAEEHRRLIQRIMNEDIMENSRFGETYIADGSLWARVPEFEYRGPGIGWALAGQGTAAGGLLLGLVLARAGATSVARRA